MAWSPPSRLNGLDTLRAVAILLVLMFHYSGVVSNKSTFGFLTDIGWTGVDLFFVLSGYLIGNQILSALAQGKEFSLKTFYARRLLRTLPNYYFVLAIYLLFPLALNGNSTASIWQFLSFTQNVGLQPGDTFTHSWSLCIEEQFYLILPISVLLIAATSKSIRVGWLALSVAILSGMTIRGFEWFWHGGSAISSMHFYEHIYYSSFARFDELLPGVALAMFKNFNTRAYEKTLRHGNALMVGGMIAVAAMFYLMSHKLETEHGFNFWLTTFGYSFMALSFGLLTLSALSPYSLLNQIKVPGAANLALWSYALYLAHKPIFKVAIDPVHRLGISTDSISGIAIIMVSSLLGGWLLFQLVETPFMRLRERLYPSGNINPQKMIENADAMQNS